MSVAGSGNLDLDQYQCFVCVAARTRLPQVRSASRRPGRVIVANEDQGGIPDPDELGLAGYRDCLALLDEVMPQVAQHIRDA